MSVFQTIKQISCNDTARLLGLKGKQDSNGRGRWCCPFHDDRHPSMACYDDTNRFYCFGCQVSGDAADLYAQVKRVNVRQAAYELCRHFALTPAADDWKPPSPDELPHKDRVRLVKAARREWLRGMIQLVEEDINAAVRTMERNHDKDCWMWNTALSRGFRLQDELNRLNSLTDEDLPEEISERLATGEIPIAQPQTTRTLLMEVLEDILRREGRTKAIDRAYKALLNDLAGPEKPAAG